ncbi:Fic family protein [Chitinophaga sp. Hz27]|uniref:Fic family protein n=1 Tax=Chitinophaga sp. Hz27 TaxID=3347169 RepID=UPI0035DAB3B4
MNNYLLKINELAERLKGFEPIKPEFRDRINRKVRLEFNYNSNHIEGNTLTYGETKLLLIFDKTTGNHDFREYEEMKAHDVAFEIIQEMADDKERPLSKSAIRNLHEVLLVRPYWRDAITATGQLSRKQIQVGVYKTSPNHVQLSNGKIFHYTSPDATPAEMQDMVDWYRKEEEGGGLHPVQLAALLHYRFVRMHPFDDGNGRMSRLLMNYVLLRHNYPPVIIKSDDKKNYLNALNDADIGDLDVFISYIEKQLIWSLELYIKAATGEILDEDADLKKEIELWMKETLAQKHQTLYRNTVNAFGVYSNSDIKGLFQQFAEGCNIFNSLFKSRETTYILNSEYFKTLQELDSCIKENDESNQNIVKESESDVIHSIGIVISLEEYNFNSRSSFNIEEGIFIDFLRMNYVIRTGHDKSFSFEYTHHLTKQDQKTIIETSIREVFERIKQESIK